MAKLKIAYSHEKELFIVDKYKGRLQKEGREVSDVAKPAPEDKVSGVIRKLTKAWEPKEENFIKQLNQFYDSDFDLSGWTAYLIRFPICPYWTKDKWFAMSFNPVEKELKTIGHELFHQPFHLYWQEKCEEIFADVRNPKGAKENLVVRALKEALPELLNTPKFKLSEVKDEGHPEPGEQFIRHLIRKYYQAHGPFKFEEFLESIS